MFSSPATFGHASKTWNSRILFRFMGRRLTDTNITFLIWVSAVLASVHDVLVRRLESVATLTLVLVIWWGTRSGWKDSSISLFRRLFWWCIFDEFDMLLLVLWFCFCTIKITLLMLSSSQVKTMFICTLHTGIFMSQSLHAHCCISECVCTALRSFKTELRCLYVEKTNNIMGLCTPFHKKVFCARLNTAL